MLYVVCHGDLASLNDDLGVFVARCLVLIQDLLCVLYRLELLSLIWIFAGLKKFDECVVGHVSSFACALSLVLDVIVFNIQIFFVKCLLLNGLALEVRVEVLHVGEAHVPRRFRLIIREAHTVIHSSKAALHRWIHRIFLLVFDGLLRRRLVPVLYSSNLRLIVAHPACIHIIEWLVALVLLPNMPPLSFLGIVVVLKRSRLLNRSRCRRRCHVLSCFHEIVFVYGSISMRHSVDVVLVVVCVHQGRLGDALQSLLLLLAHDQGVVKAVNWRGRLPCDRLAHDLLVVERRHALLMELFLGVICLLMWARTGPELERVALPNIFAEVLGGHQEVLSLLAVVLVLDAGAAALLALLHCLVHQVAGRDWVNLFRALMVVSLAVDVLRIRRAAYPLGQVTIGLLVVLV